RASAYWLATANGAFKLKNDVVNHFTGANGLVSGNMVNAFLDNEDNCWLASAGGDGFFISTNNRFTYLNKSNGLPANSVRGLALDSAGKVWIATQDGGLSVLYNQTLTLLKNNKTGTINACCLYNNKIFLGTSNGIWVYDRSGAHRLLAGVSLSQTTVFG